MDKNNAIPYVFNLLYNKALTKINYTTITTYCLPFFNSKSHHFVLMCEMTFLKKLLKESERIRV